MDGRLYQEEINETAKLWPRAVGDDGSGAGRSEIQFWLQPLPARQRLDNLFPQRANATVSKHANKWRTGRGKR